MYVVRCSWKPAAYQTSCTSNSLPQRFEPALPALGMCWATGAGLMQGHQGLGWILPHGLCCQPIYLQVSVMVHGIELVSGYQREAIQLM